MRKGTAGLAGIGSNINACKRLRLLKNLLPITIAPDANIIASHNKILVDEIVPSAKPAKKKYRIRRQTITLTPNEILNSFINIFNVNLLIYFPGFS